MLAGHHPTQTLPILCCLPLHPALQALQVGKQLRMWSCEHSHPGAAGAAAATAALSNAAAAATDGAAAEGAVAEVGAGTYYDLLARDPDVAKVVLLLTGSVEGLKAQTADYLGECWVCCAVPCRAVL